MIDLTQLGLNLAAIAGIIGLTEVIKEALKSWKYIERYILLVPALLGLAAAVFLTRPLEWQSVGENAIKYIGAATFLFKFGKTVVGGK